MPADSYSRAARRLSPCTLSAARGRPRSRNARIEVRSSARPSPRPRHSGATASCPTQPMPSDSHTSDSDTPTILPSAAAMNHHAGSKLELSIDRTRHGSNVIRDVALDLRERRLHERVHLAVVDPKPELPQDHTLRVAGRLRIAIEVADHPPVAVSHDIAVVRQQAGRRGVAVGDVLATGQAPLERPRLHQRQQCRPDAVAAVPGMDVHVLGVRRAQRVRGQAGAGLHHQAVPRQVDLGVGPLVAQVVQREVRLPDVGEVAREDHLEHGLGVARPGRSRLDQKRSMYWSISHRCTCSL